MRTWRITYTDGTWEEVRGSAVRVYNGLLTIDQAHSTAFNMRSRTWPLTAVRSWEEIL